MEKQMEKNIEYYLAPMEGITGFVYRKAYSKHFNAIDKYFTPFIVPTQSKSFKTKELLDILPENNIGMYTVPQILTNDADGFIDTAKKLEQLGYSEINLNLGCPSGTVVAKNRGSGFLAKREELERFLDEIFKIDNMNISIKTRIGKDSPDEFYELIKIYNKYPMEELIIHPRTREDFYGNKPNLQVFKDAIELSKNKICYNGDIFTVEDDKIFKNDFPQTKKIMVGRGIIANPGLVNEIKNNTFMDKETLKAFQNDVFDGYRILLKEDRNAMYRMKELWGYMIHMFSDSKKYAKKIKKSQNVSDYKAAVDSLFEEQEIIKGAGLFNNQYRI